LDHLDLLQYNLSDEFYSKLFYTLISSYLICSIGIFLFLKYFKDGFHQPIREDGPQNHIKDKGKTPTLGGLFIILATVITTLLFADLNNPYITIYGLTFLSFGAIGLVDDILKISKKNSGGFRGSIKLVIQFLVIAVAYLMLGQINPIHNTPEIFFPIFDGYYLEVALAIYILFITFVIVGTSNAVNLTDGLDGLVSLPAIVNLLCLIFLIIIIGDANFAKNFNFSHLKNSYEIIFLCSSLIGAILGFLQFNYKPAKIFMGDVGSLSIGSFLGLTAVIIKQEIIFFIISLVFVAEAISVILQVGSYKIRKKRIFLMAPLHHHFEKKGWSEIRVVRTFWFAAIICALFGMAIAV
jgi:phospho-N-acetylmuramoyl-pentapeptide-transferase